MRRVAKDSVAYTLVFALGYFIACNSASNVKLTSGEGAGNYMRMMNSTVRHTAIFPTNTGAQSVLASVFSTPAARSDANITAPSNLGQSFESVCAAWGSGATSSLHSTFGNSGLVPLNFGQSGISAGNICSEAPIASVGSDENGNPKGFPIFFQGTINNLAVYGILASGNTFRCLDTTNTSSLQDSTYVRAYYDLAHDAILLGSGTAQLAVTCSISIPAGDDVNVVQVQWVKS